MIVTRNVGVAIGETGSLDSNEVANNTVSGDLACFGNDPASQFGDSGVTANTVGGDKLGQCGGL